MLCLVIGLGAYRAGFENGYADRINQREEVGATFAASYDVRDVVPTRRTSTGTVVEFDPLIRDVEANVLPKTWKSNGGQACIAEFATNLTLVVSHDKDGHERVSAYLETLREKKARQELVAK